MTDIYKKKLSLFVAWFHILACIALPIAGFVIAFITYTERQEYFYSDLQRAIIMAASVIPWLIASILLVKGIKQNRPKLMAPWIYLGYLQVIACFGIIMYMAITFAMWTRSVKITLMEILPLILGFVFFILCIIPVRKLYQRMSIPAPVQPTQIVMASEKPMEVGPSYMPVFEDV